MNDREPLMGFNDGYHEVDEEFARQISAELRTPEIASADFEARVMAAIRAEAAARKRTRTAWLSRRAVHLTPLRTLALAAGLAAVAYVGGYRTGGGARQGDATVPRGATAQQIDTVHVVRFVFFDNAARTVHLVGDFNHWRDDVTPLLPGAETGVWTASVELPPGVHEYAFIVDGERWEVDPFALSITDEFGARSSLLRVDAPGNS